MRQAKTKVSWKSFLSGVLLFSVILVSAYYISNNWYQLMLIQGDSMSPAYHNMQLVVLNRYDDDFTYGDVIAFRCDGLSSVLVKRIVACPGDSVVIENGTLLVNGENSVVYPENNIFGYAGILENKIYLGEGQYAVLGDNMAESKDSRYPEVGCVAGADILGRIAYPIGSK